MLNKSISGASLAELLSSQVARMTPAEISALRVVLVETLPAYIAEAAKRAEEIAKKQDGGKSDEEAHEARAV